jgi:tricorn protease
VHRVTERVSSIRGSPAWDPAGNYLYYLSNHDFAPLISSIEFNYATNRADRHLRDGAAQGRQEPVPAGERRGHGRKEGETAAAKPQDKGDPQVPREPVKDVKREPAQAQPGKPADQPADQQAANTAQPAAAAAQAANAKPPATMTVDFDGITARVTRVPVQADNYGGLSAKTGFLLYGVGPAFYYGRAALTARRTVADLLDERPQRDDAGRWHVRLHAVSDDGSKLAIRTAQGLVMMDAIARAEQPKKPISTDRP